LYTEFVAERSMICLSCGLMLTGVRLFILSISDFQMGSFSNCLINIDTANGIFRFWMICPFQAKSIKFFVRFWTGSFTFELN